MSTLLHKCMTKATTAAGDQMRYSPNWVVSRRAMLKIYDDHIECGDWNIPYSELDAAVLSSIRSTFFMPGYILRIDTADTSYHFGLNWGKFWKLDLPFEVQRERGKLGYSKFSLVVRVLLIGYIGYLIWQRFAT